MSKYTKRETKEKDIRKDILRGEYNYLYRDNTNSTTREIPKLWRIVKVEKVRNQVSVSMSLEDALEHIDIVRVSDAFDFTDFGVEETYEKHNPYAVFGYSYQVCIKAIGNFDMYYISYSNYPNLLSQDFDRLYTVAELNEKLDINLYGDILAYYKKYRHSNQVIEKYERLVEDGVNASRWYNKIYKDELNKKIRVNGKRLMKQIIDNYNGNYYDDCGEYDNLVTNNGNRVNENQPIYWY